MHPCAAAALFTAIAYILDGVSLRRGGTTRARDEETALIVKPLLLLRWRDSNTRQRG